MRCGTICAILVEGIKRKKFCEIILNLDQWFSRRCCLKHFLSGALAALLFDGAEPFVRVKLCEIWTSGLGGDVI